MTNLDKEIFEYQKELAGKGIFFESEMAQYTIQLAFEKGAKWKEKQMIEKSCEWLEKYVEGFMPPTNPLHDYYICKLIHAFKIAMINELKEGGEE